MKKIVLLGDSIRMGYDKYVKEALSDVAEVYYPSENCRFSIHLLRFAHEWKGKGEWPDDVDLVHWNAGLWDALELFEDGPLVPIPHYKETIVRINRRLRLLFPKAKFIFATSTSVLEGLSKSKNIKRSNRNIEDYNKAALEALENTDTQINDLYSFTKKLPSEYHSDAVHFATPDGTEQIGGRVISMICKELGIDASDVNIENFEPECYTAENIGY